MELTAGFEPALSVPKTEVLPLDDTSIWPLRMDSNHRPSP